MDAKVKRPGQEQVNDAAYRRVLNFYYDEAELFDNHDYETWLATCVVPEIQYRMPVRNSLELGAKADLPYDNGYFMDDFNSLAIRIQLWSKHATTTAESPPSITRHFVTNIRAFPAEQAGRLRATSHVLVYRTRATEPRPYLFSARREDLLDDVDGMLRLVRRDITMDEPVVMSPNLSFLV